MLLLLITAAHLALAALVVTNLAYLLHLRQTRRVPETWPSLSVVIPARNEEENLRRLLPSLLTQRYPTFEVIVYDDASTDGTGDVLQKYRDPRLHSLQGDGPPPGWIGKVHALYQATRHARHDLFLFLDADTVLPDDQALHRLVERHAALPPASVLTGITRLCGGGRLLVSLVPFALLGGLPLPLIPHTPQRTISALNGQCWMITRDLYTRLEPHAQHPAEVLEDVMIGRYLKSNGVVPYLLDLQDEVEVRMYKDFSEAWEGFRKNGYLLLGGKPGRFAALWVLFVLLYVLPLFVSPWFFLSLILLKLLSDRFTGFSLWVSLLSPLSFLLASLLQLDSALSHWVGTVQWKGRRVG